MNILELLNAFFFDFTLLVSDVWHQKPENKKEDFKNYLKYSFNRLLKVSLFEDPVFGQNRILIPDIMK